MKLCPRTSRVGIWGVLQHSASNWEPQSRRRGWAGLRGLLTEPALPQISGERTQGSQKTAVPCLEHSVQLTMPPIHRDGFTFSGGRRNQDETICQSVSSPISGSSTLKHFPDLNPGHQVLNLPLRHTPEIGHPSPISTTPSLKLGGESEAFPDWKLQTQMPTGTRNG